MTSTVLGQLLAAIRQGSPRERAAAISITISTVLAVGLIVGSFGAVFAVFRGLVDTALLLGLIVVALCWMAFVLLGDVVLVKLFEGT